MKRFGKLWHQIIDFENLLLAAKKAQKGKRFRGNVLLFNESLAGNLLKLQRELKESTYQPGKYRTFRIFEPKPRLISAAPYRDRIVHHALCNVIVPLLEPSFIHHSYANRVGFGSHRALRQFIEWSRGSRYVLQCDIRKYFPSIDHKILKGQLHQKLKCLPTLGLIDLILDNSNLQEAAIEYFAGDDLLTPIMRRKGLPIGNLTSQFFSNWYLNEFDHFVKENLGIKKYLRYVDDFALFSDDRSLLKDMRVQIEDFLAGLRLKIHPIKSQLFETKYGANFLGFRVLPERIRVRSDNLRRSRIRLKNLQKKYQDNQIDIRDLISSLQSWEAHLKHGDTYHLRQKIFSEWIFV